jgi:hypothetical protein
MVQAQMVQAQFTRKPDAQAEQRMHATQAAVGRRTCCCRIGADVDRRQNSTFNAGPRAGFHSGAGGSFGRWRPMSGQHDVGCDQEPKRIVTYERNIDEHRNYCEPRDNKRNHMYAENVEHRWCPLPRAARPLSVPFLFAILS